MAPLAGVRGSLNSARGAQLQHLDPNAGGHRLSLQLPIREILPLGKLFLKFKGDEESDKMFNKFLYWIKYPEFIQYKLL